MLLFLNRQEWSLFYFQENCVFNDAEAMPTAHHQHDIAGAEFARGDQFTVIVYKYPSSNVRVEQSILPRCRSGVFPKADANVASLRLRLDKRQNQLAV